MPRQIDIDWAARIMIGRHGRHALAAAQRRITSLVEAEDITTAAIWVRVERAIRVLQGPLFPAYGLNAAGLEPPDAPCAISLSASQAAKILDLGPILERDTALLHPVKHAIPMLRSSALDLRELVVQPSEVKAAIHQAAEKIESAADQLSNAPG